MVADSGTPNAFLGANESGWHSFGYFSFATERKVTRRQGETTDIRKNIARQPGEIHKSQSHKFPKGFKCQIYAKMRLL